MKKQILLIAITVIIILGIIATSILFFLKNRPEIKSYELSAMGNLVINNPGIKPNVWHLVYEEPESPAKFIELAFSQSINSEGLSSGTRVKVSGKIMNGILRVDNLVISDKLPDYGLKTKLYFYNPEKDKDSEGNIMCGKNGLSSVPRFLPDKMSEIENIKQAIEILLRGEISDEEKTSGIGTEFPLEGFSLTGAELKNGELRLSFKDPQNKTIGGSCRVGILWAQIYETAKQFPSVSKIIFTPEDLFQP